MLNNAKMPGTVHVGINVVLGFGFSSLQWLRS